MTEGRRPTKRQPLEATSEKLPSSPSARGARPLPVSNPVLWNTDTDTGVVVGGASASAGATPDVTLTDVARMPAVEPMSQYLTPQPALQHHRTPQHQQQQEQEQQQQEQQQQKQEQQQQQQQQMQQQQQQHQEQEQQAQQQQQQQQQQQHQQQQLVQQQQQLVQQQKQQQSSPLPHTNPYHIFLPPHKKNNDNYYDRRNGADTGVPPAVAQTTTTHTTPYHTSSSYHQTSDNNYDDRRDSAGAGVLPAVAPPYQTPLSTIPTPWTVGDYRERPPDEKRVEDVTNRQSDTPSFKHESEVETTSFDRGRVRNDSGEGERVDKIVVKPPESFMVRMRCLGKKGIYGIASVWIGFVLCRAIWTIAADGGGGRAERGEGAAILPPPGPPVDTTGLLDAGPKNDVLPPCFLNEDDDDSIQGETTVGHGCVDPENPVPCPVYGRCSAGKLVDCLLLEREGTDPAAEEGQLTVGISSVSDGGTSADDDDGGGGTDVANDGRKCSTWTPRPSYHVPAEDRASCELSDSARVRYSEVKELLVRSTVEDTCGGGFFSSSAAVPSDQLLQGRGSVTAMNSTSVPLSTIPQQTSPYMFAFDRLAVSAGFYDDNDDKTEQREQLLRLVSFRVQRRYRAIS